MKKLTFHNSCDKWPRHDVHADGGLCDMVDNAVTISRRTFLQNVDRDELQKLEQRLGYAKHPKHGLTMASDYHLEYCRSKLHGKTVYFFTHSAVEYVFA